MFAEAQAASPRPGRKRLRKEEGKVVERSSGEGTLRWDLGGQRVGGKTQGEPAKVSGVVNLGDWQARPGLGGPFRGTWPPGSHLGVQNDSLPTPPPRSSAMKEPPLEPGQTLAGADRQERGRCVTAQRGTCAKGGGRGRAGQALGKGLREPGRTRGSRD